MTVVQNTVLNPGGQPLTVNVRIVLATGSANTPGYAGTEDVSGTYTIPTDQNGSWTATLVPNVAITPENTYYQVFEGSAISNIVVPASGGPYGLSELLVEQPPNPSPLAITGMQVAASGTVAGVRPEINLIAGTNVTVSAVDNAGANRVDVTVSATGGGGGGDVDSVNAQTGVVVLAAGDVGAIPTSAAGANSGVATLDSSGHLTASQAANLDPAGAASTAQSAAETFATNAVATETTRAETAEATKLTTANALSELTGSAASARSNLGLGSAATQSTAAFDTAGSAASAQAAAETFATGIVTTETSRAETAEAAKAQGLNATAVKTGAYTLAAGDWVPVNVSSGNVALTLPNAPATGTRVGAKMIVNNTVGTGAVTLTCQGSDVINVSGGSTTATLQLTSQGILLQYLAGSPGVWYVQADDLPLTQLDLRYVKVIEPSGDTTGATDYANIQAAINAASTAGGGTVTLAAGTFTTTKLTLPTSALLRGSGRNSTIVQLAAGVNDNLIETTSFATLTGTNTTAGTPNSFGIEAMTLDGNASNQSGSSTSNCCAIYGYGYRINAVTFRNAVSWGLWSEWGLAGAYLGPDGMEAYITDTKIHGTNAGGLTFIGPHDSQVINMIVCKNTGYQAGQSAISVPENGGANGAVFTGVHVYGGAYDYGLTLQSSGTLWLGCQFEGAQVAQTQILASINMLLACKWFWGISVGGSAQGVILGNASNTNINSIKLIGKIENTGGGTLNLTYAGGGNYYDISAVYVTPYTFPTPTYTGSFSAQDTVTYTCINNSGVATSDSFTQSPVTAKLATLKLGGVTIPSNTDEDPLGYGYATTAPQVTAPNGPAAGSANSAFYMQLVGYGMTAAGLRIYVGTSSGNISVGLYNNGGQSGASRLPLTQQATSGAVACPAIGQSTVNFTSATTVGRSWYAALSVDNATAQFYRAAPQSTISDGVCANQGTAHPLPATASAANGGGTMLWMATP